MVLALLAGLWLQMASAAQAPAACILKTSKTAYQEPADITALLDCQKKKLARCAADYEIENEDLPPAEVMESWRQLQRLELQDFILRHPDQPVPEGALKPPAQDLKAPQQDLREDSDQGRQGITPEMAAEVVNTLMERQGFISGDMVELLDAIQKDGPNLSANTFHRVQAAARKADASGLDLGLTPDIKESLLGDGSNKGQPAPDPDAADEE
jgi:hypothetical protein